MTIKKPSLSRPSARACSVIFPMPLLRVLGVVRIWGTLWDLKIIKHTTWETGVKSGLPLIYVFGIDGSCRNGERKHSHSDANLFSSDFSAVATRRDSLPSST